MTPPTKESRGLGRQVAAEVAVKAAPSFVLAGIIPMACFLIGERIWGLMDAICLALAWNGAYQAARWLRGRPVSGLLLLGLIEMVLRGSAALALRSVQVFFMAPAIVTAVVGAAFAGSGLLSKPLIGSIVADLVPDSVVDLDNPHATRVLRKASVVYGAEQLLIAVISILMILNLSATTYVAVHPLVSWPVLGLAVAGAAPFFREDLRSVLLKRQPELAGTS